MPSTSSELFRTRLNYQITSPSMNLAGVRAAAAKLAGELEPVLSDYFADTQLLPAVQLLQPGGTPAFQSSPSALFRQQPKLSVGAVAQEWVTPYLAWATRLKRSQQFSRAIKARPRGRNASHDAPLDPIVAGLLIFLFSPEGGSVGRKQLLDSALTHTVGGYLCAQALHLDSESKAIFTAMASDSRAVLGASSLPDFADKCLALACSRHDLASGLVVAQRGTEAQLSQWLRQTGLAAFDDAAAAEAMLVLNPHASPDLRDLWLASVQGKSESAVAFDTVRWARQTWQSAKWIELKGELKAVATRDRGHNFYRWYVQFEPENAAAALARAVDPLWAFELVDTLNLDDEPLRYRLADQLGKLTYHRPSWLALDALNIRNEVAQEGGQ